MKMENSSLVGLVVGVFAGVFVGSILVLVESRLFHNHEKTKQIKKEESSQKQHPKHPQPPVWTPRSRYSRLDEPQTAVPHPVLSGNKLLATHSNNVTLVTVGLPGQGKSAVANILARYLQFFHGFDVQFFNVSSYRRAYFSRTMNTALWDENLFDPANEEGSKLLFAHNQEALNDLIEYIRGGVGRIAIFDAPNVTRDRRDWVLTHLTQAESKAIFLEFSSANALIAREHISVDEFASTGVDPAVLSTQLKESYTKRIAHYQKIHQPLSDDHDKNLPFIRLVERGHQIVANSIEGYIPSKIVQFVMNCGHQTPKSLYLTRHGQSKNNAQGRIGGDTSLTENGVEYAKRLAVFAREKICRDEQGNEVPARMWVSTLKRTHQTVQFVEHPVLQLESGTKWSQMTPRIWSNLDEIYAGVCDGMTYEEIERYFPHEASERARDKLGYRYPKGESYLDVIQRLEPCIHEIERYKEPLLICSHQGVIRMIYAFYKGIAREDATNLEIKTNHVYKLTPTTYGCIEEVFCLLDSTYLADDQQKKL